MKKVRIIVSGRVQGVGFRWSAQRKARQLELGGYVRNLVNGDVEIVAEGDEASVNRLIAWARQGPSAGRVDDLRVDARTHKREFEDFDIRF